MACIRCWAGAGRTSLVNTARSLAKSYGERLRGCNVRNLNPEKAESLSPELQRALEPLLSAIEELSERICEYNRIEALAQESYPQVALLKQIKGVGTLIALTFLLTLEDPHRFRKSRDVGCYLGLQPGRRNSGQSEPQMHFSKEGDPYRLLKKLPRCGRKLRPHQKETLDISRLPSPSMEWSCSHPS